jgi:hypothetical protein
MKKRMVFIPELREQLLVSLAAQGVHPGDVERALQQWNDGNEPRTLVERGCFDVFRKVESDINKAGA